MARAVAVFFLLIAAGLTVAPVARAQSDGTAAEIAALRREMGTLVKRQQQQIDALQQQVRSLSAQLARTRSAPTTAAALPTEPKPGPVAPRVAEALPEAPKPMELPPLVPAPVLPPAMFNLPGRSVVAPYTGTGPGAPGPAPVTPAAPVSSGGNKVALSLSGQVDNNNSSTRFRIVGETMPFTDKTVAGMNLETEIRPNSSATQTLTQNLPQPASAVTFTVRQAEIFGGNPEWGEFRLGFGSTASYLTAEIDISGTAVASYEIVSDYDGGFAFRQRGAALVPGGAKGAFVLSPAKAFGPAVASVFNSFDGLNRDTRIRYDSPLWEGFQLATSVLDGGAFDFAGRFAREYDDFRIAAGVGLAFANSRGHTAPGAYGYAGVPAGAGGISLGGTNAAPNSPTTADVSPNGSKQLDGSVSVLLKSGFNLTVAGGVRDPRYHDPTGATLSPNLLYVKLGYQERFWPLGITAFSVDFAQNEELTFANDKARAYGIAAVQNVDQFGLEVFIAGRWETLNRPFASYHPIFALMTGGRVRF